MGTILSNTMISFLKPLQNKKGQKNLGYPTKKQSFYKEKRLLFCRVPQIFWPFLFWSGFSVSYRTVSFKNRMRVWSKIIRPFICSLNKDRIFYSAFSPKKGPGRRSRWICYFIFETLVFLHLLGWSKRVFRRLEQAILTGNR